MSKHYTPQELVDGFSQLHTLPEIYFRIKAVVDDPKSQAGDLVRELGTDPALTARILRVVNSPLYAMRGKVETLLRAVSVLGTRAIHDLVLATSVTGMITKRIIGHLDMREHWRQSLATGLVAQGIGQTCQWVDRDRLFVEGLLSRIGEVVMHERIGAVAVVVSKHALSKALPLQVAQRNFLGCHFGEVGAALLRKWQLPETLCAAIAGHLESRVEGESADVGMLRLAAALAPAALDSASHTEIEERLTQFSPPNLSLDPGQANEVLERCRNDMEILQQMLLPPAVTAA